MDGGLTIARFDPALEWPETEEELTALFGPGPPPPPPVAADPEECFRQAVALTQLYGDDPWTMVERLRWLATASKEAAEAEGRRLQFYIASPERMRIERRREPLPRIALVPAYKPLHDATDAEYHLCIEALHRARKSGDPPLNRDTVWARGPVWLLRHHRAKAHYVAMRQAFGDPRHAAKRRRRGQH
jgi:hypothetical protein